MQVIQRRKLVATSNCFKNSVRFPIKFNDTTQGLIELKISQPSTIY